MLQLYAAFVATWPKLTKTNRVVDLEAFLRTTSQSYGNDDSLPPKNNKFSLFYEIGRKIECVNSFIAIIDFDRRFSDINFRSIKKHLLITFELFR